MLKEQGMTKVGVYSQKQNAVGPYFVPTADKSHVSFAHSFAHTDNYIVIWDSSVQFEHDALMTGGSFFQYNPKRTLKFGLMHKNCTSHEDVIWIDSGEPGAILHSLHAWEEVEEKFLHNQKVSTRTLVKLWTPLSQDFDMDVDQCCNFRMVEFTIDVNKEKAVYEVINHSINTEMSAMPSPLKTDTDAFTSCVAFPSRAAMDTSDDAETRCTGTLKSTDRFGFSGIYVDQGVFVGYAKWDMLNRCLAESVYYGEDEIGGEPVVIRAGPDQIYVGSYVYKKSNDHSYFVLYDANTSLLVCRLKMPQRVPQGFHGTFIDGNELESHYLHHEEQSQSMKSDYDLWENLFHKTQAM